ncbi:hypothetical protein BH09BAC5_BH09BAC5_12620 [soil metagenome]
MKRFAILLSFFFGFSALNAQTNPGDTILVQAFTFGSPQNAWFVFPSDTMRFEKVIMKYKLKCNPAQNPACGEWDYLTNTYVYKPTGLLDSTVVVQPTLLVNGVASDSVEYSNSPTYSPNSSYQYFIVHSATTSLSTDTIGSGSTTATYPFGASNPVSRSQFLWKATEMTAAGMVAGDITGLQFYLQSLGGQMRNLTIRMQHTTLDSLTEATLINSGFSTVYSQNTQFALTGWNDLQLLNSFNWNGTSNLLIEIDYDNQLTNSTNVISADTTALFKSALNVSTNDHAVSAIQGGHIDIPYTTAYAAIDSFITVSYWSYGDDILQPQSGTCFEAIDSIGQRVLNVHGPWSDSKVYWDAGNVGGNYDRISKLAVTNEIKGQWNYWTYTKNAATGSMKIYLNGTLWYTGTGMVRLMKNIKNFRIEQGNWGGSLSYAGRMDEFTVYNKELSPSEIMGYMNSPITQADPNYANLVLHFSFEDANNLTATDSASGNHSPAVLVNVMNDLKYSTDLTTHFTESKIRPRIVFEQGVYTSHVDSVLVTDSTLNIPFQIIVFNDSINNPGVATDTIIGWPVTANASLDSTIYLSHFNYYNTFPQVLRYELARYITPYGNGLSLGNGWTWTFDVSDYVTLLHDSVNLAAGNWQELLDVKFLMIVGTPPRDVVDIQNLYNGNFNYGVAGDPIDNYLPPLTVNFPPTALTSRWKSRITGHGMDTPENCAEFCPKNHYFFVNNTLEYTKLVWRDNCDRNPLYPQGGTWVYDRSNWCPGAEVWTYDMELTPYVTAGNTATLNHDVQAYTHSGGWDYYQIEDQVVFYGNPNFTLDARLDNIISPTTDQMWLRYNPICTNPVVVITNTGSTDLTSLTITYGMIGGTPSVYNWTGNLKFMESATVALGTFNWVTGATEFNVTLSNPNGGTDQYSFNNSITTPFTYPPVMPSIFVIDFKSNSYPNEDSYTLKDDQGNIIWARNNLTANTTYKDTLTLGNGCYTFELIDSGDDGLTWWANTAQGSGYLRFRSATSTQILKSFNSDFGGQVYQQFTVGLTNSTNDYIFTDQPTLNVYPNPSDGHVYIDVNLAKRDDGLIEVFDVFGKLVYTYQFKALTAESVEADLSMLSGGMYFVTLITSDKTITKRLIKN